MHLYNSEQILSWDSVSPSNGTRPVAYRVQFKYTSSEWSDVSIESIGVNCTQVTATECDFTAASPSKGFPMHFNVYLRVRAELGEELVSAWATVPWFQHYRNVTVGPPENIWVTQGKGSLIIRFSPPFAVDTSLATFKYYVHYRERAGTQQASTVLFIVLTVFSLKFWICCWNARAGQSCRCWRPQPRRVSRLWTSMNKRFWDEKPPVKGPFRSNSILLDNLKPFRVYCLQVEARLFWRAQNIIRPGQLSNSSCYETTADASTKLQQDIMISVGVFSLLLVLTGACFFLVLKYRGLVKYWFHSPPSIPSQIEEYLKDPAQPILEALDNDSSPKDDAWDSVSIISLPEKEQEDILQTP
ncbi:Interferon gamma receptor 2 [Tupaia chinensis]|uniref:Interferon gamma receptor 2 n=1 Tax=Tupaia chinensis TaxID=246437 RepID=L9KLR3_TUPCH|nr:Interferon gamma receptor 2 [Tupaia chinensis]